MSQAPVPPGPPPQPTQGRGRSTPSPLTALLLVVVIGAAAALYLLTRQHGNESDVVVALAQRDIAAFSLLQGTDVSLAVRPASRSSAWHSVPAGPLLLLKPVAAGEIVQPDDVLALSGISMPRQPVVIDVKLTDAVNGEFVPGQQVDILGNVGRPAHIPAVFLAMQDGGHEAVLIVSGTNSDRFGPALAAIAVTLVRPL